MKVYQELRLPCQCPTHEMQVTFDDESEFSECHVFWFSYWQYGHGGERYNLLDRLGEAWYALINGHPYSDMITLSRDDAKKLAEFIEENLK